MRLGFEDRSKLLDNVAAINAAGANELVVHGRTRADGYKPPAYWDEIARVRQHSTINVVANGEIWSPGDAAACRRESGCQDLMLGRGMLCRPDLARLIADGDRLPPREPLDWARVLSLLLVFLDSIEAQYDARYVGNPIKQWLGYLRHYYPQAGLLLQEIRREREPAALREALLTRRAALATEGELELRAAG